MFTDPALTALLHLLRTRADRVRALHRDRDRDRGALSIELAILVAALVVIAGIIVVIVTNKATQKGNAIP
ncbi:hypothetical protein [Streptacidiphilus rugosus]|uniref:hypothetical protein n=1 Tax=Streptacidiphilus rugosus TaxID=405783 RepID=UPI000567B0BA|nr:hypothetical protein [Streptacidiphilus rugosus]